MGVVDDKKNVVQHTHITRTSLFLSSLVWHCCIWSWVKERGCKAPTPTANSWTTIDGKELHSLVVITTPPWVLCFFSSSAFRTLFTSLNIVFCAAQDWIGVFGDEGAAQRSLLIPLPSPLHPSQPALPPVALRRSAEAGAVAGQATVSCISTHINPSKYCDEFSAAFIVENKNWRFVLCHFFQDLCFDQVEVTRDINTSPSPLDADLSFWACQKSACACVSACSRGESMVDHFNPAESLVTFVFLCV